MVCPSVIRGQRTPGHARDHLRPADHRPAERMAAEDCLGRDVVDEIVRRVLDHRDLLEHDLALGVELVERRPIHHVRHDVERGLQPFVRDAGVDDGRLSRGRRVQLPTELVEDLGDLLRRVARRALEEQVLDEMRDACASFRLVPRPRSDPEPERDRAYARDALGDDALAGGELAQVVLGHRRIVSPACSHDSAPHAGDEIHATSPDEETMRRASSHVVPKGVPRMRLINVALSLSSSPSRPQRLQSREKAGTAWKRRRPRSRTERIVHRFGKRRDRHRSPTNQVLNFMMTASGVTLGWVLGFPMARGPSKSPVGAARQPTSSRQALGAAAASTPCSRAARPIELEHEHRKPRGPLEAGAPRRHFLPSPCGDGLQSVDLPSD